MPTTEDFSTWYDRYCAHTDRHTGREVARAWHAAGFPAEKAATWARFGFTYESARPHLDSGITAATAAARKGADR